MLEKGHRCRQPLAALPAQSSRNAAWVNLRKIRLLSLLDQTSIPSMASSHSSMNRFSGVRPESADPFAMQLALSRVHARLVPMQRGEHGYAIDASAERWFELPAGRGFAGYGLGRALRMLLDVLRGLTALHDTFDAQGESFAHGEVALTQLRVDPEGVCRLVPLTPRHSSAVSTPPSEALGHLAPERLLGERVDARADVFSAGVLLWEALAGRRLFNETTAEAIIDRLMGEKLQMPQLPPELAWAIPLKSIAARALSVDPYQRFADCAELATAIAIVARERVATHAEILAFFGSKVRSLGSVAQPRPIPTRSSTFPSLNLSVPPASVNAPASSRNGFPLATPPVPMAAARIPDSNRSAGHKSPFAALLSAESRTNVGEAAPASEQRWKTLTSVGTPPAAQAVDEPPPDSADAPTSLRVPLPPPAAWVTNAPFSSAPTSQPPTSSSAVVARARIESIPLSDEEAATFGRRSPRRALILLGLVLLAGVIALVALAGNDEATTPVSNSGEKPVPPATARVPEQESAVTSDDQGRRTPAPPTTTDLNGGSAPPSREFRPASKTAPSPKTASGNGTKDYGI